MKVWNNKQTKNMKTKTTIKTDADALRVADELAAMQPALALKKAELEAELQKVRDRMAPAVDELQAAYDSAFSDLETYCRKPGVMARLCKPGKKAAETDKATFGLREGKPALAILPDSTEAEIIERMQQEGKTEWLTASEPKLNKAAVLGAGLDEETLEELGLQVVRYSKLFVKPKDRK